MRSDNQITLITASFCSNDRLVFVQREVSYFVELYRCLNVVQAITDFGKVRYRRSLI